MRQKFKARIEAIGPAGAWSRLEIPFDVHDAFGSKARVSVKGTINGFAFRTSIFPNGDGSHHMMVNKAMQAGAKAKPGDRVAVEMELDTAERKVDVPSELTKALAKNRTARDFFARLSPSCKKAYADWITSAKKSETRIHRVTQALEMLNAGKKR